MPRFKSGMQRWYEAKRTQDDQGDDDASASEEESDGGAAQEDETLPDSQERRLREPPPPEDPLIEAPGFDVSDIAVKMETEENDSRVAPKESSSSDLETSGCRETYGPEMQRALEDLGAQTLVNAQNTLTEDASSETLPPQPPVHVPRKRGRPRKNPLTPQPVKESCQPQTVSDSDNLLQVLESMRKEGLESSPKRLQNVGIHLPVLTPGEHYCMVCLARHQQRQSQGGRQTRSAMLKRCTTIMCRACNQFLCVSPRTDGRTCFDIFHTMQNFADSDLPEFKRSETDVIREEFIQEVDAQQALEAQRLLALLQEVSREASKTDATETEEARSEADPTVSDIGNTQESHELKPPDSMADPYKALEGEQQQQHLQQQQLQQLKQQLQQQQHSDVERIPEEVAESATSQADGPRAPMSAESQALELLLKFLNTHEVAPLSDTMQLRLERKPSKRMYTPRALVTGGATVPSRGRGRPPSSALGRRRPRKGRPRKSIVVTEDEAESALEGTEDLEDILDTDDPDNLYIPPVKLRLTKSKKATNGDRKRHKCPECPAKYSKLERLKVHMRTHTGDRPFDCPECDAKFMRATHLKQHLLTHTGRKPHKCSTCGASFAWSGSLKEHVMRLHTGERPFKCTECDAGFTRQINLHEHMRSHTGEKPYKCPKCDQSFARKSGLKNHMTSHTGEKPYLCSTCGARFRHKIALTEHQRTHTGEKPFGCQHCGQRFAASTTLRNHVRLHTGEKPHKCRVCGAGFAQRTSLNCHMKKHGVTVSGKVQRTTWAKNFRQTQGQTQTLAADQPQPVSQGQGQMQPSGQGQIQARLQGQPQEYEGKPPLSDGSLMVPSTGLSLSKMAQDMPPNMQSPLQCKFERPPQITSPPPQPPPQPQHHGHQPLPPTQAHHPQHHSHSSITSTQGHQAHNSGHGTHQGHHHGNQHLSDLHHLSVDRPSDVNLGDKAPNMPLGHWPQDPSGLAAFPFDPTAFHSTMSQAFPGMLPGQGNHAHGYHEQPRFPLDNRFSMDTWPAHSNWKQKYQNNPNSQPHSSRSLQGLLTRWRDDQLTGTLVTSLPLKRGRGRPRGSRTLRLGQSMRIAMPTAIGRRPRKATPQRRHLSDVEDFSEGDELLEDYYNKGDEDGEADGLGLSPGGSAVEDGDLTDDYSPEVQDPFKRKRGRPRKHKLVRLKPMGRNRGMKRKHRCTICEMTFVRADHLHHHILKHSSDKPFKCDQCSAAFKINSKLKEHLRVHTGERPFECQQCNQRFMRATHLKKHMMAHTGEKPFVCALCGRSFTNNASLKEHHYRHTGERPHKCNKCDVAFTRKISLQEHMRIHTGERPFKCPCCDMSFARRNGLRNHMTLHTGEKPYLCQTCGARFRHNTAFAEHVRIHTGTKPYVCQHCGTAFTCKSTLKKHVRLHTGEKPYKCSVCGAGFAQRTSLVCHIKKHPGLTLPAAFASHRTPKSDGPEVCINPVVGRNKKARLAQHHPQPQPQHLLHQHHHQQPQPQQPQQQQHQQQQQQHQQHQQHQQPQSIPSMPIGSPMAPPDRNLMNHTPTSNMTSRLGGQPGGVANTVSDEHSMGSMSDMTHSSPHHTHQVHSAQHPAQHPAQHSAHLGLAERGAAAADHRHSTSHLALGHWTQDPPGVAGFSYDHQVAHHGPHHLHHQAFPGVLPMPGQMAPAFPEQQRFPLDYRFSMT